MLPFKALPNLRNKWWTLAWAAGIVWMAIEFAGGQDQGPAAANAADNSADGGSDLPDAADQKAVANFLSS
jgi:hypothetical protein